MNFYVPPDLIGVGMLMLGLWGMSGSWDVQGGGSPVWTLAGLVVTAGGVVTILWF